MVISGALSRLNGELSHTVMLPKGMGHKWHVLEIRLNKWLKISEDTSFKHPVLFIRGVEMVAPMLCIHTVLKGTGYNKLSVFIET